MREIPTLQTPRLELRGHRATDLPRAAAMWADPTITRHTIGNSSSEHRTWMRTLAYLGHWQLMGFGYWANEEKATGHYVGELGFADFKRDLVPPLGGTPELGWVLAAHAHGQGYATEALKAAIDWGDAHLNWDRTVCLISPANAASLRVAEKCGYREILRTTKNGEAEILFERTRGLQGA
jgi:RimJ/RimL family protein N-acetyltransferase